MNIHEKRAHRNPPGRFKSRRMIREWEWRTGKPVRSIGDMLKVFYGDRYQVGPERAT